MNIYSLTECHHIQWIRTPSRNVCVEVCIHMHALSFFYSLLFFVLMYLFSLIYGLFEFSLANDTSFLRLSFLTSPAEVACIGSLLYGGCIMRFEVNLCRGS